MNACTESVLLCSNPEEWDLCSDACQTIWKMQAAENADIASYYVCSTVTGDMSSFKLSSVYPFTYFIVVS